eukprot:scaffold11351_cov141-Isochrysis_galbana.AAC.5
MISINQPPPNWGLVADRYATRFLTPKDTATHFKHIIHRAIFTHVRRCGDEACARGVQGPGAARLHSIEQKAGVRCMLK